jgi:agmatine deiminase
MRAGEFTPGSPAALGYRMPAEFEPHAATWLSWPHKEASWPGKLERIPPLFLAMVRALVPGEIVNILVNEAAPGRAVQELLRASGVPTDRVRLHEVPTDDAWIRDSGPTFITQGAEAAIVNWGYNAWGGKYPPWDRDDVIPERVAEILGLPVFTPGMILEGGSIDVNGRGTLMTTESCLLNDNRNPQLDRAAIEQRLRDFLGVRHILWLGDGIVGDDTDGHVDDLTRFVDATTVVTVIEPDPHDANHEALQANYRRLTEMRDQDDRPLRVVTLPMPHPITYDGQRLPASYANFYIGNAAVLLPTFEQPSDAVASGILADLFPERRVVGIPATDFVWGLGACHCATQQQPLSSATR